MPINWKSKIILAKIETVYGTDSVPVPATNAVLGVNVAFTPMEGDDVSRELERPYLGAQAMIPTGLRGRLRFKVELVPSGTAGTAPAWGPLLRACACAQVINAGVSTVFNPVSTAMDSLSIYFWIGNTRHILLGSRGDAVLRFPAQGLPYLEFDFIGLWMTPTETAPGTPTLTGYQNPVVVTKANTATLTVNAVPMVARELNLSFNNQVQPRLLIGSESIVIPDRQDALSVKVEAVPLSTFNPYTLAQAQTAVAVTIVHGTVAGRIVTLSMPSCQMKRLSAFDNAQNIVEWPLELVPLPVAGNDQWTLTLS